MRILACLLLAFASTAAFALPTVEDVEHAVHRGDYTAAENMTREVLKDRPNNAKAHYILAELLAHENKVAEAKIEAATAQKLDPAISFTSPDKFRQFQARLDGGNVATPHAASRAPAAAPEPRKSAENSSGISSTAVVVIIIIGAALFLFARRRNATPPAYGPTYSNPPPNVPPGAPGYPGYGYGGPMNPPPGSGMGGHLAAGLGGVAAGMLAEHLIEEGMDRRHHDSAAAAAPNFDNGNSSQQDSIDFGSGSDWGSDSGGGGSDGGGFDSGGGSDWS